MDSGTTHGYAFAVFDLFREEGAAQFKGHSQRSFSVRLLNQALAAPSSVQLDNMELRVLATMYNVENALVDAIRNLYKLLGGTASLEESSRRQGS
jgi:hypothetical protein